MARIFVDLSASRTLTNKLEQIRKSAFPLAVRGTLNAAAFDVKMNTLEQSATRNFIRRVPTFFKRFSGVSKANGLNVDSMQSEVGMTAQGVSKVVPAIRHLAQQEEGGDIGEGLHYLKATRGGNNARKVTKAQYYNKNKNVRGKFKRATTQSSKFVAAAYVALKQKKRLAFKDSRGTRFTLQVTSIKKFKRKGLRIKSKILTMNREGQPVNIKPTHFSREAANLTVPKLPMFYAKEAQRQFDKILRT